MLSSVSQISVTLNWGIELWEILNKKDLMSICTLRKKADFVFPQMAMTFDDQFLLTVSEDGCLLMWKIIDKEGRGLKSNRQILHAEEILVNKSDLEEKV